MRRTQPPDQTTPRRHALRYGTAAVGTTLVGIKTGANASAATISRSQIIEAYGFEILLSPTPPTMPTINGYPVYWIPKVSSGGKYAATPEEPYFDDHNYYVRIPAIIGVEYQDDKGNTLTPHTTIVETGTTTIVAVPLPGYAFPPGTTTTWVHEYVNRSTRNIITSDAFRDKDHTPLSAHKTDARVSGTPGYSWVKDSGGEAFTTTGNPDNGDCSLTNTSTAGSYHLDTKTKNLHASFKVAYPKGGSLTGSLTVSVGATAGNTAVGFIFTNTSWQAFITQEDGTNKILETSPTISARPDGYYTIELLDNQFAYKTPVMDEPRYYDVSSILKNSNRGTCFTLNSTDTTPGTITFAGFQIDGIDAL